MKFELLGWKCEGLRCPDFNFEINKSGNATATFLQMPNGTGKTTTLRLLKRSLYNHQFKSTEIDQYKAKLKKEYKDKGFFQAKYKIEGNIFYTQINFEFDKNNSYYTSSLTEKGGFNKGFQLPESLENIIDQELIDLLFVDLEIDVKPMFRNHQTGAQEAIRKFCKINLIDLLIKDFDDFKTKKRKENAPSGNISVQIDTEETRFNKIINKIEKLEKVKLDYKKYLNETEDEFNDGEKQLNDILESNTVSNKKRKDLELRRDEAKSNYDNLLKNNLEAIKNIGSYEGILKDEIDDFVKALDDMGLPEEEVRIFFKKILEKKLCICGEELDHNKKLIIKEAMESFISDEESRIIGRIKGTFDNITRIEKNDLDKFSTDIQKQYSEVSRLEENIELLEKRSLKDNVELSQKIKELKEERSLRKNFLENIINERWKAKDTEETDSLVSLHEQKLRVEKQLATLSGTRETEEKVIFLNNTLKSAMEKAMIEISIQITKECNKKIDKMFVKNPIYIRSIEKNIVLDGQLEGSTGQEARIGIIFLLTILERSSIEFPLIVDTPVKGMDNAAKRRTAQFISDLKSQFLCFVIDSDKPHFTDEFHKLTNGESNFITAFRRSDEFDNLILNQPQNLIESSHNGQVVYQYPFFKEFTEEEDGN